MADAADECSDATRLCQARSAILQLKADIKAMDVLIGAKSATLMGKKLGRQQAGERKQMALASVRVVYQYVASDVPALLVCSDALWCGC